MEMFEAFGFSERVLKEAYWVNEATFWKPDEHSDDKSSVTAGFRMSKTGCRRFRTSS
jgi:phenol 2-monooxygenase